LRHLVQLRAATALAATPARVAELGPGKSYGFGLAALLAGAEHYYAFDVVDHSDLAWNLQLIDALADLFARRAPIPRGATRASPPTALAPPPPPLPRPPSCPRPCGAAPARRRGLPRPATPGGHRPAFSPGCTCRGRGRRRPGAPRSPGSPRNGCSSMPTPPP